MKLTDTFLPFDHEQAKQLLKQQRTYKHLAQISLRKADINTTIAYLEHTTLILKTLEVLKQRKVNHEKMRALVDEGLTEAALKTRRDYF